MSLVVAGPGLGVCTLADNSAVLGADAATGGGLMKMARGLGTALSGTPGTRCLHTGGEPGTRTARTGAALPATATGRTTAPGRSVRAKVAR
ncbi:hypothetical protein GCM10022222_03660 [Amycolatopsis ultiminotia]|uniref:Uncharacterized protein n=1 Tax=Amycolatopsis ultiminotia TaxID=543629 RepID=A0ABP6V1W3_9PSEU